MHSAHGGAQQDIKHILDNNASAQQGFDWQMSLWLSANDVQSGAESTSFVGRQICM